MRLDSGRIVRNVICLVSLLAFASTPLLAQTGIDLLDAEQVRRATEQPGESGGTATVRATLDVSPSGVIQATNHRVTLQYDDGEFENFDDEAPGNAPGAAGEPASAGAEGLVEWAQLFRVTADSTVVSGRVCFLRPEGDLSRSLDFKVRFYRNEVSNRVDNPGRRGGLVYNVESNIRRAGDHTCVRLRDHLVGKMLGSGKHWVGVEWDTRTKKRLAGDHYRSDDMAEVDRNGEAEHETQIRYRTLPVLENASNDGWTDNGLRPTTRPDSGLKAIGISLIVETVEDDEPEPDPTPTPDPDPEPDPTPTPEPDPNPGLTPPPPAGQGYSTCSPTVAPLTFEGGIKVSLCYETPMGEMEDAKAVYRSDNSGLLYFFEPDNAEVFVKVLDGGCDENGYRWVYMAALTDVAFNMYVNDGQNLPKAYHNRPGENHALVQDQMAFPCSR